MLAATPQRGEKQIPCSQKLTASVDFAIRLQSNHRINCNRLTEKTYVNRIQMSVPPRCRRRWHHEPRLVAEPVEARTAAPAFLQVQPDGQGLQLRQGIQKPRP